MTVSNFLQMDAFVRDRDHEDRRQQPEQEILTMSSREIAHLCDKRHDHVLRDIEKMLQDIAHPNFGASDFLSSYIDSTGRRLKEYRLPKDLTVTLITGYRADLRYRVVKRLEEMEIRQRNTLPDFSNPAEAARAWADQVERNERQATQIAGMREDVAAYDRLARAEGSLNITEAAKNLGVRPKDLFSWLARNGWIYKRPGSRFWLGFQEKCNRGFLEHKTTTVTGSDGMEKINEQVRVTPRGLTYLAKMVPGASADVK
ncbi:phage antirepressor KilAC domain-containing protein [Salipiger sp.]|uniref:phage antirepressor KilAC domain-containing protein n=1 Tax=Salipiger sp. TaxID=2078585 RepID=UPI003A97A547